MRINKDQISNYIAKALPYGSYVLDLKSNSSDIDLVCVCPAFINMETHFFGGLAEKLEKYPEVVGLSKRVGAAVPIITFDYKDINIDLSFCQLNSETIPRDIERVISTDLVNSINDKKSKTALLGRKNNMMILELTG
jgi:poly(A) polymerase